MRHTMIGIALATAVLAAGCNGGNAAPQAAGPEKLVIESGNHQTITAHRDSLVSPLVGQLVRLTSGQVAYRRNPSVTDAIFDRLGLNLYAQTVVKGSPVPGGETCAQPVASNPLTAFKQCNTSDATGHVVYFFHAGTKAGQACALINGDTTNAAGQVFPVTFDTACATVLPDTAVNILLVSTSHPDTPNDLGTLKVGSTIDLTALIAHVQDRYQNDVPALNWNATAAFTSTPVDVTKPLSVPTVMTPVVGNKLTVPTGARTLYVQIGLAVQWFIIQTTP